MLMAHACEGLDIRTNVGFHVRSDEWITHPNRSEKIEAGLDALERSSKYLMNRESMVSPLLGMSWRPLSRLSTTLSNPQHSPVFG